MSDSKLFTNGYTFPHEALLEALDLPVVEGLREDMEGEFNASTHCGEVAQSLIHAALPLLEAMTEPDHQAAVARAVMREIGVVFYG